jgi:hypothetical protein
MNSSDTYRDSPDSLWIDHIVGGKFDGARVEGRDEGFDEGDFGH